MRLAPGKALQKVLDSKPGKWDVHRALLLCFDVALALESVHRRGYIHRDIKPSNIIFDRLRRPAVLIDFGVLRDPESGLTAADMPIGTPRYMAPEQIQGTAPSELTSAADVYTTGLILFELIERELIRDVVRAREVLARKAGLRDEPELRKMLCRCLSEKPEERPTARELAQAIEAYAQRGVKS